MTHRHHLLQAFDALLSPERFRDYGPNGLQVEGRDTVRTIVSGVNALSKSATPTKTFGDLKEALAWLQSVPGQTADVKALKPADLPSLGAVARAA